MKTIGSDGSTYREWCSPMTCPAGQIEVCECQSKLDTKLWVAVIY